MFVRLDHLASVIVTRITAGAYEATTYIKIRQGLTLQNTQNIRTTSAHSNWILNQAEDFFPAGFFPSFRIPQRRKSNSAGYRKKRNLMSARIVRNIFISVGVLFALTRLHAATFITFDVPNAFFTVGTSINPKGTIPGSYLDASFISHGFVRAPDGTITTFDVPGAVNGTGPSGGITPNGTIPGSYADANFLAHGFVRAPDGAFTTFDVPGAVNGILTTGINPEGTITGFYTGADFILHGFVRAPGGTITTFDVPGVVNGTDPEGINPKGTITGAYTGADFFSHGFVRAPDGTITTFDFPGAVQTRPIDINPNGTITGFYTDASFRGHAFVRIP